MAIPVLTSGALKQMQDGQDVIDPVLQIMQMKRMNPDEDPPRFKLALTDGTTCAIGMATGFAGENLAAVTSTDVFGIIKLLNYQYSMVNNKNVLIIIDFEQLMPGSKVGRSLFSEPSAATNQPPGRAGAIGQVSVTRQSGLLGPHKGPDSNASSAAFKNIHPIESLTPYQNKWCIKARVTDKRPIKHYSNSRGEGKLFSVDLTDNSGEIRATAFNQECDRFFDLLKEGQIYFIRGGQIKPANKQFSSLNNDYELTFSSDTQIDVCHDNVAGQIPAHQFNFVPFNQLQDKPKEMLIDVIGVLDSISPCETIVSKQSQKEFRKRNIRVVDDTNCSVSLTLWAEEAENFESKISSENPHPIVAVKGVKISDFQGVSLSVTGSGRVFMNPDRRETYRLRNWYDNNGANAVVQNLSSGSVGGAGGGSSQFTTIAMADAERLGTGDKPDYFTIKATISALKRDNCLYKACPSSDCNKKLVEMGVDSYRCEKCNKEYDSFKWRLMLAAQLQDFSGQLWVTFFDDMAQSVLKHTSEDLGEMRKRDEEAFNVELNKVLFTSFAMRLRAKMETFNDETRVKFTCAKAEPLKYDEYIRYLEDDIRKMEELPNVY